MAIKTTEILSYITTWINHTFILLSKKNHFLYESIHMTLEKIKKIGKTNQCLLRARGWGNWFIAKGMCTGTFILKALLCIIYWVADA